MSRKPRIVSPAGGRVRLRPTPAIRRPAVPVPRPTPAPSRPRTASVRKTVQADIRRIHQQIAKAEAAFHAAGEMLLALDRPDVLAAFGAKTFNQFLDEHVMPSGTAHRYMTVAREFERDQAVELGVSKAYHLVQYATIAKTRSRASALATRDAKIGKPGKRISAMSAAEVADAVRREKMDAGRAAVAKATTRERKAAKALVAQFEERFGMDATMRIDKKRGVLRLEVKLSDLLE
ncbi:MAG: hypothetical protein JJ863_38450 [Deltaproteobacteria bacterium]|nr:hypothetical protein [Deltaproteobacteria bacterium]